MKTTKLFTQCAIVFVHYNPYDMPDMFDVDVEIERAAKQRRESSGAGGGYRDLEFVYGSRAAALDAAARIRKVKKHISATVGKAVGMTPSGKAAFEKEQRLANDAIFRFRKLVKEMAKQAPRDQQSFIREDALELLDRLDGAIDALDTLQDTLDGEVRT